MSNKHMDILVWVKAKDIKLVVMSLYMKPKTLELHEII